MDQAHEGRDRPPRNGSDSPAGRTPVYLGPDHDPVIASAIEEGGGRLVPLDSAEVAVWTSLDPHSWNRDGRHENLRWVQLLAAGVEGWIASGVVDNGPIWTSARGASALTVAEHALALTLAVRHRLVECARLSGWQRIEGLPLRGATALILGCGGIGQALIPMLASLEVSAIAVTRSGRTIEGAAESHSAADLPGLWPRADITIVAAPATPRTRHIIDTEALRAMPSHTVVVNVARGCLIDTDALVDALRSGGIAGAGLDVTEPEPLPDDHPLWAMPNALITSHVANPGVAWKPNVATMVAQNLHRYRGRQPLLAVIDLDRSY